MEKKQSKKPKTQYKYQYEEYLVKMDLSYKTEARDGRTCLMDK